MTANIGLKWLKQDLRKRGIDPLATRDDLSVSYRHKQSVPVRGSVHISSERTIGRKMINLFFLFPFLYKK